MKVYELALTAGLRSPFLPADELHPDVAGRGEEKGKSDEKAKPEEGKAAPKADEKTSAKEEDAKKDKAGEVKKPAVKVNIDFTDLPSRLSEVPVPPGNYGSLQATEKRLCWMDANEERPRKMALQCVDIANKGDAPDPVLADLKDYEISADRKKMLIAKGEDFFIVDADVKGAALGDPKALPKARIDMSRWTFATNPRAEFHELFLDAWRLERDYFYDRGTHGLDWKKIRDRYLPLVDRVSDREELNDVIAQLVSELSTLHIFVYGGDSRKPADHVDIASLGAHLRRDTQAGGYIVQHIYRHDPDLPNEAPPLARPDSLVREGETIVSIDGDDLLSVADERELLQGKAGRKVLLRVKGADGKTRDVLTTPMTDREENNARYKDWEISRRLDVDAKSKNAIGYVHLRAMGPQDIEQWTREFYPIFDRQGLIIDVRHNRGGNIDSWLLAKLLRKAWFYWQPRVGDPYWNMQYAFRGHIVVLCDQLTASDGEAFAEGFRRLGLGKVIGMRTWGGEVWLSSSNVLADRGIATAAEYGVYGPEGKWLIEGHGVDPDIVVDDLPHATFAGGDAQLDEALKYLQDEIRKDPRPVPKPPQYPNKAFKYE
jgi:tricorn protease